MGFRLTLIAVAALLAGACRPADPVVTELIADSIVAHGEGRPNPAVGREDVPALVRSLESGPVDHREDTLFDGARILYEWNDRAKRIALHREDTIIPLRIEQVYSTLFPNREVGRLWMELSGSLVLAHWLGSDPTYITLYDKRTGRVIDEGQDPFGGDVLHDALMFTRRDDSLEYLVLYEEADRRTSIYRAPSDNQILLGERWRVVGVDARSISIGYENTNRRDTVVRLRRPSASGR